MGSTKRKTAFLILAAWAILLVFSFSERLGYFQDTDEYAGQSIEQALSSPVETTPNNSNHILKDFPAVFLGAVLLSDIEIVAISQPSFRMAKSFSGPPQRHQKIYQYTSAYLI